MDACLKAELRIFGINAEGCQASGNSRSANSTPSMSPTTFGSPGICCTGCRRTLASTLPLIPSRPEGLERCGSPHQFLDQGDEVQLPALRRCRRGPGPEARPAYSQLWLWYRRASHGPARNLLIQRVSVWCLRRGASVRIPWQVEVDQKGYIEDRRPCANVDPYVVTRLIMESVCASA